MAAIASSRIATGSVFQKPQAKDASAANGADTSSPFQQILSAAAANQAAGTQAPGRDPGKKSGKDFKPDGTGDPTQQAAKDQIVAAADSATVGVVNATEAKNQDTVDRTNSSTPAGNDGNASPADQSGTSAPQQTATDANQVLIAAQTLPPPQTSAPADDDGDASLTDQSGTSAPQQTATDGSSQIAPSSDSTQDAATTPPGTTGSAADASQPSAHKAAKDAAKQLALSQILTGNVSVPSDVTQTVSSPAPAKDAKPGKAQDAAKDNGKPAAGQATSPDPSVVNVAATVLPIQSPTAPAPSSDETNAATAISGATKGMAKNSAANSNPGTDAVNDNPASGETAEPRAAAGKSPAPANAATQDGTIANPTQSGNSAQASGNPQTASGDASTSTVTPAHDQVQTPVAQPQTQAQAPQTPVAAIQPPAQPQTPANALASVSQNVQVGPQDSSSAANTLSALAVAIAVKSQSGTKQFDIRLDPPELGRVEVRLSIDPGGKAQASLSADQPRTLDLLKTDASTLTRALRDAGLNVSQNGLNFSLRGQDRQNGSNGSASRSGRASQPSLIATSAIGSIQGGANFQGPADGRLDIRV